MYPELPTLLHEQHVREYAHDFDELAFREAGNLEVMLDRVLPLF